MSPSECSLSVCGVVPSKGTSRRVPSKNRQELMGVPLFLWAANNLSRVLPRRDIFIDSESEETLSIAERAGFGVIKRPEELATNATEGNGLMHWGGTQVASDLLVQHMPTMPFLKEATLRRAIERVIEGGDSAFGVVEEALYLWSETGPNYAPWHIPNDLELEPTVREGMGLYVARRELVLRTGLRLPGCAERIALDKYEAIDIGGAEDLDLARTIATGLKRDSPYKSGIELLAQTLRRAA